MKRDTTIKWSLPILLYYFFFCTGASAQSFTYPPTPKQPVADTIFGRVVVDNYRWLEDVNQPKVQAWLKAQATFTDSVLNQIPGRQALLEEYKKLNQLTTVNLSNSIHGKGGRYFYTKALPGDRVGKLYYRQGRKGKDVLLFDPDALAKSEGKQITFRFWPSEDGKKVALALSEGGKFDINTLKVLNVDTKTFTPENIYPVHSLQGWSADSKGFVYAALPTDDHHSNDLFKEVAIKYHQLGKQAKEDNIVLSHSHNPQMGITPANFLSLLLSLSFSFSPDHKYLIINLPKGSFYASAADLKKDSVEWKPLPGMAIYKENVYFLSDGHIMASPLHAFDAARAKIIIPKSDKFIEYYKISRDFLFVVKSDGINATTFQYSLLTGKLDSIQAPYAGGNAWINLYDESTNDCFLNVHSWLRPSTRYDYDPVTKKISLSPFNSTPTYPGVEDLVVEEVEIKSHDGTMVPLSIFYNKNIKRDGSHAVFMTGFGAYGVHSVAIFNLGYLPLLNRGVIIARAHVRGGGEKGEAWHKGGFKATKPNTWKDFIASAEYLINKGYTSPGHLITEGFSSGGITVGRAMTERPDLFAATIHSFPLSNPFRGENRPNGASDAVEFGTVKDSVEAMGLIGMDTYLNVKPGVQYPAVLAVTGTNDPRVPLWQPGKLVAALQSASASKRPFLLRVNYGMGHGPADWNSGLGSADWMQELANQFAFALWQAGHKDFQLKQK
jgi:prolyl oligopeptidase